MLRFVSTALVLSVIPLSVVAADISQPFEAAEIVVLGEIHDNAAHHVNQAHIVQMLQPDALVFEMIGPSRALSITEQSRRSASTLEELLEWNARGWPDFEMYYPIFSAAPEAAIFGGEASTEDVRRAVTEGASVVFGDAAALFGIDEPIDAGQLEARIKLQNDVHCGAMPEELLPGMVEAQRLRDAILAKATVAAFEHAKSMGNEPQVVVITGNGHAREDWGVPHMLRTYFAEDMSIDIRTLGQYEEDAPADAPFTSVFVTEPAVRDDPCATFR